MKISKATLIVGIFALLAASCASTLSFQKEGTAIEKQEQQAAEDAATAKAKEEAASKASAEKPIVGAAATPDTTAEPAAQAAPDASPEAYVVERLVYVERPIYYPVTQYQPPKSGPESAAEATKASTATPETYNGRILEYDYDETITYQVYCQPLRVTDVYLEPGEVLVETPFMGDSSRWQIGYNKSLSAKGIEVQHIYIKPNLAGLETTMIINTTKRIYYILLRSYPDVFMAGVRWRYANMDMPQNLVQLPKITVESKPLMEGKQQQRENAINICVEKYGIDKAMVSTDYTMKYPGGSKTPAWLPAMVFDDGKKTYIYLPPNVGYHEIPGLLINKDEMVNYRLDGNVMIVDRLVERIILKLKDVTVTISKVKGAAK